jgi:hypothetical protein
MSLNEHTPKHFVLQLGSLVSLYLSVTFLLVLLFGLINVLVPDTSESYYMIESHSGSIRLGIAMLVVFFPTYLLLTRAVNRIRRQQAGGTYLSLTRWLIYLSLLIAGTALLVDLVMVIMAFLEGDLTQRFLLKVFAVFVVIGVAFHYYLLDARGYWLTHEGGSIKFALGAALLVLASLAYGVANIEPPAQVREGKIDEKQVQDLQNIQFDIENYYVLNKKLPQNLDDLSTVATAPEERPPYSYSVAENEFQLCATFVTSSENRDDYAYTRPVMDKNALIPNAYDWEHPVGEYCFRRTVNEMAVE